MNIEKKFDQLIEEVCEKTGVDKPGVIAVMEELGLKESLEYRKYEVEMGRKYGLESRSNDLNELNLTNLRISSSVNPI